MYPTLVLSLFFKEPLFEITFFVSISGTSPIQSRILIRFITNYSTCNLLLFRKDQGPQVCLEPGVGCLQGPVQPEILRLEPGKNATQLFTDTGFSLTQIPMLKTVLRIRDVYPGSRILIFTHSGSRIQKQQQKRGVKKNLLSNLFLKPQISQNWKLFFFSAEEKNLGQFSKNYGTFYPKICH